MAKLLIPREQRKNASQVIIAKIILITGFRASGIENPQMYFGKLHVEKLNQK